MIHNFIIIALRNIFRTPVPSILNIAGLTTGLTCAIYAFLFSFDELTYDTQHPDAQNTYRMLTKMRDAQGKEVLQTYAILGWAHYMRENLKGVNSYSCIRTKGWLHSFYYQPTNGEQRVALSEDVLYVDKNYPQFFFLDLIAGDKNTLFNDPGNVAISESAARELFGDDDALGRSLQFSHPLSVNNEKRNLIVKGVFRDLPYNIQLGRTTRYLLSGELEKADMERWYRNQQYENMLTAMWHPAVNGYVYIKVDPGTDLAVLREKLEAEINKAASAKRKDHSPITLEFLKITDTHFSDIPYLIYPDTTGNRQYLYIFIVIGAFVLIISCINYTNLTTAQRMLRAKEVGVRKTLGSQKWQILSQFLQESFILTGAAMVVAVMIAIAFLPYFSDFANKDFVGSDILSIPCLSAILLLWIIVSAFAGLYPAFHMTRINSLRALKGELNTGRSAHLIRKGLMVFQFSISLILLAFTMVVINQMNTMINTDLNEAGDQIMTIRYGNVAPYDKLATLQSELSRIPDLSVSSYGNHLPRAVGHAPLSSDVQIPALNASTLSWDIMSVGANYDKVFDLKVIAGSFFDSSRAIDSTEVLINEEAARQLQLDPEGMLGLQVLATDPVTGDVSYFKVRGVFKDFKYKSIYNKIEPLILSLRKEKHGSIAYFVRLPQGRIQQNVAAVEKIWKEVMPADVGFKYNFLSDEFERLYFEENTLHDLARIFTVLGILTTSIGLFGMSMFLADRKSKEMAIRKVMGAERIHVFKKMIAPFIEIMAISSLIGLPIAYYVANKWLDNFAYKVQWSWMLTVLVVSVMLVVTLFTVSFQSLRIVNSNPTQSLKHE